MALVETSLFSVNDWHPSRHQLKNLQESCTLPSGFPSSMPKGRTWDGSKLGDGTENFYQLTDSDCDELDAALTIFKAYELDGDMVNQENFPLPYLQHVLESFSRELHSGKGFFVLGGLAHQKYTVEDSTVIFLGIQSYIASQRARQDEKGNMVVHIISDSTVTSSATKTLHSRHSKASITFHTEETGDIIAWQTRKVAARGGRCIISSANTIYNVLSQTRPDIIRTLARADWPFATPQFHCRPILFYHDSRLIINFCRTALLGSSAHPRPSNLPSITPRQREALDAVEAIARATELEITTRPGSIHFINNLNTLHRREEFVDDEVDETKKRHLIRMRLRNDTLGWSIPEELKVDWEAAFGEDGERFWHIEPMPELFFPLRRNPL